MKTNEDKLKKMVEKLNSAMRDRNALQRDREEKDKQTLTSLTDDMPPAANPSLTPTPGAATD